MQRRILGLLALPVALGLALAGCGGSDSTSTSTTRDATGPITVWYSNNEQEVKWGKAMVAEWYAAHPDQTVTGQEIPAGRQDQRGGDRGRDHRRHRALPGAEHGPVGGGPLQRQGGLVNLSDFADGASYIEARSGKVAEQYKSPDGGYYQLPWKSNPVMIIYNKKIFAKAGLDPKNPKLSTYDDFLSAARKIKSSGAADFAIDPAPTSEFFQSQFDFMPVYAAETNGTGLVVDNKATFADQAGIDVATFWKTLYAEGLAGKETYQGDPFADGKAAMAIVGPWAVAAYKDKVSWGSTPVPTKTGTPAAQTWTFSDAKNIGMFTACQNQGTAWELLKFVTSQEQDGKLLDITGQMPLRSDLQTTYADLFTKNPSYQQFGDQAARTIEVPSGPHTVEMLQALRDAYTKAVIAGQGEVGPALAAAADQVTQLAQQG